MKYQFVHADFLYNITSGIRQNESGIPLWDVIPFVGVGMIHNSDWINNCICQGGSSGSHPFAFTYGVEARYRISDRVHLVGEVSGMLTARNFDGIGTSTKFGDNMISVSAGLSFTIGKTGWKRVVDATPYIEQNLALQDYIAYMRDKNAHLESDLPEMMMARPSIRKQLQRSQLPPCSTFHEWQQQAGAMGSGDGNMAGHADGYRSDSLSSSDHLKVSIGVPVYFFFKLNTDKLVDKSQLVNLDDIAKMAKQEI